MAEILWEPRADQVASSGLTRFRAHLRAQDVTAADGDYEALRQWSLDQSPTFWQAIWDFAGVQGARGAQAFEGDGSFAGSRWFPEAMLNYAQNLLDCDAEGPALIFRGEDGRRLEWSRAELRLAVGRARHGLQRAGVGLGDRVAGYLPNLPEAIVAMLASASLGAIWSSCSPDFGVAGVVDRFGQIEPKVLIAADGYLYKSKPFDTRDKLADILSGLPSVQQLVLVRYADPHASFPHALSWEDFLGEGDSVLQFEPVAFNHPLYILYSSGTTGKPKCIVHGHGGTLLQHLKEHQLHTDIRPGEKLFYFTTTGWMMWNWLVTVLASGGTAILFDGNPFYPGPETLWKIVADEKIEHFGTSAKYLDACKKAGYRPGAEVDLSALRSVLSTGSPLVPESFDWVYAEVKGDLLLASITGGTDIVSCFALGNPELPVRRGELQCRGLGMAVEVWSDAGEPLVGKPGELVCTQPFPSAPVGFWRDDDGSRYRAAYFEHFPGIWRHGDWVECSEAGGLIVYGRSDATLNPGGVRIGTAELYRQVEQFDEILEAIVGGEDAGDGDQEVVLFVRLADGLQLGDALRGQLRAKIRAGASPRHVPTCIVAVPDIPRTRSGKISEIAVRDVLHGRTAKNVDALANPESLDHFLSSAEA
ncbi:MAG: acetoacetate--CoA ligase [Planctomycetes bacterium]|nr:acetoacetate--CoA ligase [Planctomycetota bacterium]